MGFDGNLPLKERLQKRRRQKRIRKYLMLVTIFLVGVAFVVYSSGAKNRDDYAYLQDETSDAGAEIIEDDVDIPASDGDEDNSIEIDSVNIKEKEDDIEQVKVEEVKKVDYEALKSDLKDYISKFHGHYGIYFVDLESNQEFGINDTEEYKAASTFKIPLNLYVYDRIRAGAINPEGTLKYTEADYEDGAGTIRYNKTFGKAYTIRELLRLSIVYSDNVAVNMLLRYVGRKNVKNYMRELGGKVVNDNSNVSCPKDMALYLKEVYKLSESGDPLGKELMDNLTKTDFHDRIPALLPNNVKVAHKTGNLIGIVHDVGIVFADKPYIIAVMSKGVISDPESNEIIANISKKTYDFVKSQTAGF